MAILFFWSAKKEFLDYPKSGSNIIAFGDSLVEGTGASSAGNNFVSVLARRLNINIINAGVGGDTTFQALERLERDILSRDPKIVIILLGGNDAIRRMPVDETFKNLSEIIDRAHAKGAGIILLGVRGGIFGDKYKNEFAALAKEKRVSFVPNVLDDIFGDPKMLYDTIHPNDAGYALIADRVEPILRKLLGGQ